LDIRHCADLLEDAMTRSASLAAILLTACVPAEDRSAADAPIEVAGAGFATPESMLHDPVADVYLVSNINGSPSGADDNGFISRLSPDGAVIALKWIDGAGDAVALHAPKGMAIKGDTLFVADIDSVRLFDRSNGSPLGARGVAGATFLNDVAVGPDGGVYVTDTGIRLTEAGMEETGSDALYRLTADGATALAAGADLGHPNGIVADSAGIVVVTFGSGAIFRVDSLGQRTELPGAPKGQLDGVIRTNDGALVVSSWEGMRVYRLGDPAREVGDSVPSPADIGYDSRRNRVLIPVFTENRVVIRPAN
jgi:sugar lactone lactonase YvrE